ncbi:MAG: phosphate/phosphite/phosphonate ABC transporter substrate-binding protein [Coriobacteriia bacterium]
MSRRVMPFIAVLVLLAAVAVAVFATLYDRQDVLEVSLSESAGEPERSSSGDEPLRIAVAAMTSPKSTFDYYQEILVYIGERTGRPVELVQRETYQEINDLIEQGQLDMAFVCTGAYIEGHDTFGMEILAAPVVYGEPVYYSYTIVDADSAATALADLRGASFAFTDPISNTGTLVPTYLLGQLGETPDTFFGEYIYTYSHDRSIEAVADGLVDGAAVDSLIYDYMLANDDPAIEGTRILATSEPYGIPPVVVHPDLDNELKRQLRSILLEMHADTEGRAILSAIKIDRFEVIGDSAYDSVREMQAWIDENAPSTR